LISWLESSNTATTNTEGGVGTAIKNKPHVPIRCEVQLLRALKSAPLPADPTAAASNPDDGLFVGKDLESLRADGYKSIGGVPLLRGEWNTPREKIGLYLPAEKRTLLAIDAMLGAIPFWFRGDTGITEHLKVWATMNKTSNSREAAAALLETERLLDCSGRLSDEWRDIWQASWKSAVWQMSDVKDAPIMAASLQHHILAAPDLIPRQAFVKYAIEAACPLTFPAPADSVVVLKTGLLRHIDRYMQLLGLIPMDPPLLYQQHQQHQQPEEQQQSPDDQEDRDEDEAMMDADYADDDGAPPGSSVPVQPPPKQLPLFLYTPKVKEEAIPALKAQWEALRACIEALDPVQRYEVRSVAYRRHLCDESELQDTEDNLNALRWPVGWFFLRPAKHGPSFQLPSADICIPMAIDNSMPDYMVRTEVYRERMRILWQPGDRFRMFFGGKISSKTHKKVKTGGVWYKGGIDDVVVLQPGPEASLQDKITYDPWETVLVMWDAGGKHVGEATVERVSPWEIEIDPEEERRRADDARRQQQAAQRAQRSRAKSLYMDPQELAEAAAEAEALEALAVQEERSMQLLRFYEKGLDMKEEEEYNAAVYDKALPLLNPLPSIASLNAAEKAANAQLQQAAEGGIIPRGERDGAAGGNGAARGSGVAALPTSVPTGPLHPGQEITEDILALLRPLSKDEFAMLIANFYRGLKGKFKIPTFAHQELDIHKVWWSVIDRGGYEQVTGNKLWKDICRCLDIDLKGQTSASFNMRLNYEKCLLDFENYAACGKFMEDVDAGCAPSSSHMTDAAVTRFTIPGAYSASGESLAGRKTLQTSALYAAQAGGDGGGSFQPRPRREAAAARVAAAAAALASPLNQHLRSPPMSGPGGSGEGADGTLYEEEDEEVYTDDTLLLDADLSVFDEMEDDMLVIAEVSAGQVQRWRPLTAGDALKQLGNTAGGKTVERYWPEEGGWWPAEVGEFNPETGEHRLMYNKGTEAESFEMADLAEFSDEELRYPDGGIKALLLQDGYTIRTGITVAEARKRATEAQARYYAEEAKMVIDTDGGDGGEGHPHVAPPEQQQQQPGAAITVTVPVVQGEEPQPRLILKIKPPTAPGGGTSNDQPPLPPPPPPENMM
jgi:hypothetical protein